MKSILLSFAIISSLFSVGSSREVRIFKGTSRYNSDVICSVRDSKVYKNFSTYSSDIICTVRGEKIYKVEVKGDIDLKDYTPEKVGELIPDGKTGVPSGTDVQDEDTPVFCMYFFYISSLLLSEMIITFRDNAS